MWALGKNANGQLGLGDKQTRLSPTKVPIDNIKFVVTDGYSTIAIDNDDNVWGTGDNGEGQLGLPDRYDKLVFTQIPNTKAIFAATGSFHTILITSENDVLVCGSNTSGQIGRRAKVREIRPTRVPKIKALMAAAGQWYSIIIDLNHNVLIAGSSHLTLGMTLGYDFAIAGIEYHNIFAPIPNLKAKYCADGGSYVALIDLNDDVLIFGTTTFGNWCQSIPDPFNPIKILNIKAKMVAASRTNAIIIGLDNTVWLLGYYTNSVSISKPELLAIKAKSASCGEFFFNLIDMEDNVWSFGRTLDGNFVNAPLSSSDLYNVSPIAKGQTVTSGRWSTLILNTLLDFNTISQKLLAGTFVRFDFKPEYQYLLKRPGNYIASFYDINNNVYLAELQYDPINNQILPPI